MLEFEGEMSLNDCFEGEMDDIHFTDKSGCVRYDITQDLSEEDKARARDNIGAVSDKHYIHSQDAMSDTWIIEHNLDKYPSVTAEDSAHDVLFGNVTYLSRNSLKITFSSAVSGIAYLN